jgi:hypothetical protein
VKVFKKMAINYFRGNGKIRMRRYSKADFNLNWKQTKRKYPSMRPYGDADLDGTLNIKDCKPLNPNQDGLFGRALGVITGGRMGQTKEQYQFEKKAKKIVAPPKQPAGYRAGRFVKRFGERIHEQMKNPSVSGTPILRKSVKRNVMTAGGGAVVYRPRMSPIRMSGLTQVSGVGVGQRTGRVGRPRGSYTYRNPITGKPMHVWQYRKLVNALKRENKAVASRRDVMEQEQLARRGIPPEQAQVIINARQIQQAMREQPVSIGNQGVIPQRVQPQFQQVQQIPQEMQAQAEAQRIQTQVVPWERRAAMNRLMRQQQIAQMNQQQNQLQVQNAEVSLLDGKVHPRDVTAMQRRERWTYS